ncbi:MAG: segregation ATPase FtsK/SpoIIIE, family [Actinomycetota bacterium]|nr:segregation ATPase FtsK/SpoIIIE, family [Actinomycetota bacterium]
MRFSVTVRDGRGRRRDVDVLLDADPRGPLSEVLPQLVAALGEHIHPTFLPHLPIWVDGVSVDPDRTLREAGLRPGSVVAVHDPVGPPPGLPGGVTELRVVGGPGAGRVHRVSLGSTWVGCGAPGLSLPDVRVPARGVRVDVRPDGAVTVTLAAGLPAVLDGRPVVTGENDDADCARDPRRSRRRALAARLRRPGLRSRRRRELERTLQAARDVNAAPTDPVDPADLDERTVPLPEGAHLTVGGTVLCRQAVRPPDADIAPAEDHPGLDFNRPPRLLPPERQITTVKLPSRPLEPSRRAFPWLMVVAPLLVAIPMAVIFSPRFLLFGIMSPVMAVANVVNDRRSGGREYRRRLAEWVEDSVRAEERITAGLDEERRLRRTEFADPAALLLTVLGPDHRLWERRPEHPDHLVLRLGLADRPARLKVDAPLAGREHEPPPPGELDPARPRSVDAVPVTLDLRRLGVVGVAGDPGTAEDLTRWLVAQIAALHSPRQVRLFLITQAAGSESWSWIRWLPHVRPDDETIPAAVGLDQESVGRRLAELAGIIAERREAAGSGPGARQTFTPDVVVVLDGARKLRALPGVVALLREGPAVGVHVLCREDDVHQLPEECQGVVLCENDLLTLRQTLAGTVEDIRADQVDGPWAERVARSLAPLRDISPRGEDSGLPDAARLLEGLDLDPVTPEGILRHWGAGGTTDVVIGVGFDGPFRLDLRRDGPHALVAGTTGSGKSELLQTLVASLAVANRPDELTFVLVDYKGGSAFKDCARLPHTVGMVTDLDNHLVTRALVCLGAELRRREHVLALGGAKDLEDYWALRSKDPTLPTLPRLVLVIDEFAGLVSELPDFVTGLVGIAQRGRSLGIHLVLATQRPSGVVSPEIRANTNLRIALRVTDDAESRDVIDSVEAGRISRTTPGRGYARTGHSTLMPFQTGRVGGRRRGPAGPTHEQPLAWPVPWNRAGLPAPRRRKAAGPTTDEGDTDLSDLVTAVRGADRAADVAPQPSPWLPPLPDLVTLADLHDRQDLQDLHDRHDRANPGEPSGSEPAPVPWGLQDLPDSQAQTPRLFTLGRSGHLYVVGGPRSGRSTALRTLVTALSEAVPAADLHVYGLDCGNGALLALDCLPHTGAVVSRTQTDRADRLIRRLGEEVSRRQEILAEGGHADLAEQRAAAAPADRLPYALLVLDRWEGFSNTLGELDAGRLLEEVMRLLREGTSVGLHVLISGDRTLVSGRMGTLVENKLLLRLPDRNDFTLANIPARQVPDTLPDGRGLWGENAVHMQVAVLDEDISGAGQAQAVRRVAERVAARDADLPADRAPLSFGLLPARIPADGVLAELLEGRPPAAANPLWTPLGIGGDALELLGLDLSISPVAMIAGPPRSGRSAVLRFAAQAALARGSRVLGLCPRGGPLADHLRAAGQETVIGTDETVDSFVGRLRTLPRGCLVVIDDAESLREGQLAPALQALIRQARDKAWGILVAGDTANLVTGLSGWLHEARRGRQGLLLSPRTVVDGEILTIRLPRSAVGGRMHPGRGLLSGATEDLTAVQVPYVAG